MLYLLSAIAYAYDIIIDCAIGDTGHRKGVVYGLNSIEKLSKETHVKYWFARGW